MKNFLALSPKTKKFLKLASVFIILACGPGPLEMGEFYSLFFPETAETPENSKPYFYSPSFLNESWYDSEEIPNIADSTNTLAWKSYVKNALSYAQIKESIYGNSSQLSQKLKQLNLNEAAQYLELTKEIEKLNPLEREYWEDAKPIDTLKISEKLLEIDKIYSSTKDNFVKERLGFQLVKLYEMIDKHEESIASYQKCIVPIAKKSFISDWARARLAGAYLHSGDSAKAVYEYSQVFENCPSRRREADLSVRRLPNNFGEAAIKFCKNDQEKAAVYALWAIQPNQDGLSLMEKIYEINPNHPLLELIMTREINKNEISLYAAKTDEYVLSNLDIYDSTYTIDPKKVEKVEENGKTYNTKLFEFCNEIIADKKVKRPAFWNLCQTYMLMAANDFDKMKASLALAKQQYNANKYFGKQIQFFEANIAIHEFDGKNEAQAEKALILVNGLKNHASYRENSMTEYLAVALQNAYLQKTEEKKSTWGWLQSCGKSENKNAPNDIQNIKAFFARNISYAYINDEYPSYGYGREALVDTASSELLMAVIDFQNKKNLGKADQMLVKLAGLDSDFISLACARKLMLENKFALALKYFKTLSPDTFNSEEFNASYVSNPEFLSKEKGENVSVLAYVENLAKLQKDLQNKPNDAQLIYEFARAKYNLSYFGKAWGLVKRSWSVYETNKDLKIYDNYYSNKNLIPDLQKALKLTKDKELGAKICYLGALSERHEYESEFSKNYPDSYDEVEIAAYNKKMIAEVRPKYLSFFSKLYGNYQNAAYEKMVLKECITYQNYTFKK
jgi:hypothetical protein